MKHFSLAEWADFARQVIDREKEQVMQAHLDAGCQHCAKTVGMWNRVREASKREISYEPPKAAVHNAKSMFSLGARKQKTSVVQLLFDSFQSPALAGVRSMGANPRQMLYGIGPYRIDLRMEPQMNSDKVEVVGQILNSADPIRGGTQATVKLVRGRKILVESQTNALGEFHLECSLEGQLQLLVGLPRSRDVKIPLLIPSSSTLTGLLESPDSSGLADKALDAKRSTRKKD
jgi:hypothetical protein